MLVRKEEAQVFVKDAVTVREYGGTPSLDVGVAEIKGRYPDKGRAMNTESDMTYFVINGSGRVSVEDEVNEVSEGDLVMIKKGKWYWAEGEMVVLMASSPAWSPEQYRETD